LKLEDLEIYRMAMKLGEKVWQIVEKWDYFQKDTIGRQWVKAEPNYVPQAQMTPRRG